MGRLLLKVASRPFLIKRILEAAMARTDEFTDHLREQVLKRWPDQPELAALLDEGTDLLLRTAVNAITGNSQSAGDSPISRRLVVEAAIGFARNNVRAVLNQINEAVDFPFVSDEREESLEQSLGDALIARLDDLTAWSEQNL